MTMTTIEIQDSDLVMRRYRFYRYDSRVVLDSYAVMERKTKRHKHVATTWWSRIDKRGSNTTKPQLAPQIIEMALAQVRAEIHYAESLS